MQLFVIICAVMILCGISPAHVSETVVHEAEWEEYKMTFNKYYDNILEEEIRYEIFKENTVKIAEHNRLYNVEQVTYEIGLNEFSDMSAEEVLEKYTMDNTTMQNEDRLIDEIIFDDDTLLLNVPETIDWRSRGAITPVKHQGQCGSCWAFSAIGALEAHHFIKHRKLVSLSEQNLVDCSFRNHGCNGGWPSKALKYVQRNHGVDTDSSYPYTASDGKCRFNRNTVGATVTGVKRVPRNENSLKYIVGTVGPVSVGITVAHSFHHYRNGVYDEPDCRTHHRHALVVVGYGTDPKGGPYWLVKNSWSANWGDKGYIKMARNKNICGIADSCVYPIV